MSTAAPPSHGPGVRCFLALLPDGASRNILQSCRRPLQRDGTGNARGVRWLEPSSLHMTLRFFSSADAVQRGCLQRALPHLACALPAIAAHRYAIWPNRARPRLLVLELAAAAAVLQLAHACENLARGTGFSAEQRAYRAHLTLARLRPGCALTLPSLATATLHFDTLALLQSTLTRNGSVYRCLASTPVPAAA